MWMERIRTISRRWLLILVFFAVLVYSLTFCVESATPDGTANILLGKDILEGRYSLGFFYRMPLVPSVSAFFLLGFDVNSVRFIVPLIFIVLSIPATFLFVREVTKDRNTAICSSALLLAFPMFWRWGVRMLVDIPLLVFTMLLFYCFYRALENKKYFVHCGVFLGLGMVTKVSFAILPAVLFLYLLAKRRGAFRSREFWIGTAIFLVIFLSSFALVSLTAKTEGEMQLEAIAMHFTGEEESAITEILTGSELQTVYYFLQLGLFPLIIFFPPGVYSLYRKKRNLPTVYFFVFLVLFLLFWVIRLRYFSPLYPVLMMFVAEGFLYLRERISPRRVADAVFAALLVVSFADSMYLVSLSSDTYWGVSTLADYAKGLDGNIASDYLPKYLNLTNSVITGKEPVREFFSNFSYSSVRGNNIDYIILSVYADYSRYLHDTGSSPETYSPYFGPIELAFIKRPYSGERPPPGYRFSSGLYREIDNDPARYQRVREIYRGEQRIFIIYRVL